MRCLLDTHVFLWIGTKSRRLPVRVRSAVENPDNEIFLSAVSMWEIAVKHRSGRLDLAGRSPMDLLADAAEMDIQMISLNSAEAASHADITENTHFDPFDRMLIWQAIQRNLTLVSGDSEFIRFKKEGLKLLWK